MIPLAVVNQGSAVTEVLISGKFVNLDLFKHFELAMKRPPRAGEKVIFTTSSNTEITSAVVTSPALSVSKSWPAGSGEITVINTGIITGLGGTGGTGAAIFRRDSLITRNHIPHDAVTGKIASTAGGDGGTAIVNESSIPMFVKNSGQIYGGGGGGGGGGAYMLGFAIFSKTNADTVYQSLSPDGYRIMAQGAGGGGGGGGAPYGDAGLTTLSLDWLAEKYVQVRPEVTKLYNQIESLENSDRLVRHAVFFNPNGAVRIAVAPPQNFYSSNIDISNRRYTGYQTLIDVIYKSLGINTNRNVLLYLNISEAKRAKYRSYLPTYDSYYDSDYIDGSYRFYRPAQTVNYTGSGDSNTAGMALSAQVVQQSATLTSGGFGGADWDNAIQDYSADNAFGGWKRNSAGKLYLVRDSRSSIAGGNGGNRGEDGKPGILNRIYYRGGQSGNSYTYFTRDHITRMDVLEPAVGGKAGYLKSGNVTITNLSGGITKGR